MMMFNDVQWCLMIISPFEKKGVFSLRLFLCCVDSFRPVGEASIAGNFPQGITYRLQPEIRKISSFFFKEVKAMFPNYMYIYIYIHMFIYIYIHMYYIYIRRLIRYTNKIPPDVPYFVLDLNGQFTTMFPEFPRPSFLNWKTSGWQPWWRCHKEVWGGGRWE